MNLKYFNRLFLLILFILFTHIPAKINVVTSIPDIADIAKNIGGDNVSVFSLAQGGENYHMVHARSSFLPKINRAHLVICLGLEAEERWLVPIVNASRNKRVKKGNPGWIEAYKGIEILEVPDNPESITHVGGHRYGNPHFNSGPYCGKYMAKNIYEAYITIDNANANFYRERYERYVKQLEEMEERLLKKAAPLKGVYVISYHPDLSYFIHFYGMEITGWLEPQPGIPPNSRHLAQLVAKAKKENTKLVLYHQAQNPRLPQKIAKRIGAEPVCFANMVKARENINTFIELQEFNLNLMLEALLKAGNK